MEEQLSKLTTGAVGLSGSIIAPELIPIVTTDNTSMVNIVVQIVIGIVTLFKLLKKNK